MWPRPVLDPNAEHYAPGWREGFIHCCWVDQLSGVLERYFRGEAP